MSLANKPGEHHSGEPALSATEELALSLPKGSVPLTSADRTDRVLLAPSAAEGSGAKPKNLPGENRKTLISNRHTGLQSRGANSLKRKAEVPC